MEAEQQIINASLEEGRVYELAVAREDEQNILALRAIFLGAIEPTSPATRTFANRFITRSLSPTCLSMGLQVDPETVWIYNLNNYALQGENLVLPIPENGRWFFCDCASLLNDYLAGKPGKKNRDEYIKRLNEAGLE